MNYINILRQVRKNKSTCQGQFFTDLVQATGFTSELFFEPCIFQRYEQNFEKSWFKLSLYQNHEFC